MVFKAQCSGGIERKEEKEGGWRWREEGEEENNDRVWSMNDWRGNTYSCLILQQLFNDFYQLLFLFWVQTAGQNSDTFH